MCSTQVKARDTGASSYVDMLFQEIFSRTPTMTQVWPLAVLSLWASDDIKIKLFPVQEISLLMNKHIY